MHVRVTLVSMVDHAHHPDQVIHVAADLDIQEQYVKTVRSVIYFLIHMKLF